MSTGSRCWGTATALGRRPLPQALDEGLEARLLAQARQLLLGRQVGAATAPSRLPRAASVSPSRAWAQARLNSARGQTSAKALAF